MKIWNSYGSEHSANLVMIGSFKDAASAEKLHKSIEMVRGMAKQAGGNEDTKAVKTIADALKMNSTLAVLQ